MAAQLIWLDRVLASGFGHILSAIGAFGFVFLAAYPIAGFVQRGWQIKKEDIFSSFTDEAKHLYLRRFLKWQPSEAAIAQRTVASQPSTAELAEARSTFENIYRERYGQYKFFAPTILFVAICAIAMFLFSESGVAQLIVLRSGHGVMLGSIPQHFCFLVLPPIAAAGIGGAYVWIVADNISRARRLDLEPSDVQNASLRLAIAAALSYAVAAMVKDSVGLPLAFAMGAFPLETVRVVLRRFATERLNLGVGIDDQWSDQIISLDSVDHPIADRMLDADVSTIAQLAYADPVQLTMRTGLSFDFVIDLVSQALAWTYLDDRLDDLRSAGLRGAMEIRYFYQDLAGKDGARKNLALALLEVAPSLPKDPPKPDQPRRKMERAQFLNACDQIANDPNTEFLTLVWHVGHDGDDSGDGHPDEIALPDDFDFSGAPR